MNHEPAGAIGTSVTGILLGIFLVLKAAGVGVTADLEAGITALVLTLCAVPAISGWVTRFFVFSPASAKRIQNRAYNAGVPPTQPKPELPSPPADA